MITPIVALPALGRVRRQARILCIVAADRLAGTLGTTLSAMFGDLEREELLAEVTAMAEDHGLDTGPLKAVIDR